MVGNWKLDTIIQILAEAGKPLTANTIAEKLPDISPKQLSNYIKHNLQNKYIKVTRKSRKGDSSAPWINYYTLTEAALSRYRRLIQ